MYSGTDDVISGIGRETTCARDWRLFFFLSFFFSACMYVPWSIETEENKQVIRFRDFISFHLINLISYLLFVSWNTSRKVERERERYRDWGKRGVRIKRGGRGIEAWWNSIKFDARGVLCSTPRGCTRFTIDSISIWFSSIIEIYVGGARNYERFSVSDFPRCVSNDLPRSNCANVLRSLSLQTTVTRNVISFFFLSSDA